MILKDQPTACQYGETTIIHTWDTIAAKRIVLLGMGKKAELTKDKLRFTIGAAMRTIQNLHAKNSGYGFTPVRASKS